MKLITKNQLRLHDLGSKDSHREGLQQIHFDGKTATVTDGCKLVQIKNNKPYPEEDFPLVNIRSTKEESSAPNLPWLIPCNLAGKAMKNFEKTGMPILDNNQAIVINDKNLEIHTTDASVKGKRGDARFPDFQRIIPKEEKLSLVPPKKNMVQVELNARYVKEIAELIIKSGFDHNKNHMIFEFDTNDKFSSTIIKAKGEVESLFALIMPLDY